MVKMFRRLAENLYASLRRFPISIALAVALTTVLIVLTHNGSELSADLTDTLERLALIFALGVPVTLCISLIFERCSKLSVIKRAATYIAAAAALTVYYLLFLKDLEFITITRYIAVSIMFYVLFAFIPYFYKRTGLELYVIRLITGFFTTVLYSLVLFMGLAAILFTIDTLLDINIEYYQYMEVWLIVAGIFAPCYFLSGIPAYDEQIDPIKYPELFKILLLYIIAPLLSAYTIILYIYFAKILITFVWPQGMVAHLVLWYSLIGTAVIFLISPLTDKNNWPRFIVFWFPKIILPLMIMMFVSLGIRINAYGITENRYFVLVLGLWIFGIMIYTAFFKRRRGIITLISLSLIMILAVFGPWNGYSVSKLSQNNRFEGILNKYSMIKDNVIIMTDADIDKDDKIAISSILRYFNNNHNLSDLKYLPADFKMVDMKTVFGFEEEYERSRNADSVYFSYRPVGTFPISTTGYDYLSIIDYSNKYDSGAGPAALYDEQSHEISINNNRTEIYRKSLQEFGKELYDKYGVVGSAKINSGELAFTDENENVKVKAIINHIDGTKYKASDEVELNFRDIYILFSLKEKS